jgi:hypothetical protein
LRDSGMITAALSAQTPNRLIRKRSCKVDGSVLPTN